MVMVPFGFGVGDFVTVVGLITRTVKALKQAQKAEASTRCEQVAAELDALKSVLQGVKDLKTTPQNARFVQQVEALSQACHNPLETFCKRIHQIESRLGGCPSQQSSLFLRMRAARGHVKWNLLIEDEVTKLKDLIAPQLTALALLLQLDSADTFAELKNVSDATFQKAQQLLSSADRLEHFATSQSELLKQVPMIRSTLDGLLREENSRMDKITNALGRADESLQNLHLGIAAQQTLVKEVYGEIRRLSGRCQNAVLSPISTPLSTPLTQCPGNQALTSKRTKISVSEALVVLFQAVRGAITELVPILIELLPMLRQFARTLNTLAKAPSMLSLDNIHLEDALGRSWSLPFQQFRHLPVLHSLLRCEFKGCPGEEIIGQGRYDLFQQAPRCLELVKINEGNSWIRPGSRIVMSIKLSINFAATNTCPPCLHASESCELQTWKKCEKCNLIYTSTTITSPSENTETCPNRLDYNGEDHICGKESTWRMDAPRVEELENSSLEPYEFRHFRRVQILTGSRAERPSTPWFDETFGVGSAFNAYNKRFDANSSLLWNKPSSSGITSDSLVKILEEIQDRHRHRIKTLEWEVRTRLSTRLPRSSAGYKILMTFMMLHTNVVFSRGRHSPFSPFERAQPG